MLPRRERGSADGRAVRLRATPSPARSQRIRLERRAPRHALGKSRRTIPSRPANVPPSDVLVTRRPPRSGYPPGSRSPRPSTTRPRGARQYGRGTTSRRHPLVEIREGDAPRKRAENRAQPREHRSRRSDACVVSIPRHARGWQPRLRRPHGPRAPGLPGSGFAHLRHPRGRVGSASPADRGSPRATSLASRARRARPPAPGGAPSVGWDVEHAWGARPLATTVHSTDVCSSRFRSQDDCPLVSVHSTPLSPRARERSVHADSLASASRPRAGGTLSVPTGSRSRVPLTPRTLRGLPDGARTEVTLPHRPPASARGPPLVVLGQPESLGRRPRAP
jgi:hypothetical protein